MQARIEYARPLFMTAVVGLVAAGAAGQFTFESPVNYTVGDQPDAAASADFNGDGLADLAVTTDQNFNNDAVAILLGQGDGTFAAPFYVQLPNSSSPGDVEAGDLDGDGDIDLAVGLKDNNQVIAVLNNANQGFTLGMTAPTGFEPRGMTIADIDGDKDLDLAVANREGNTATVLRNSGNATFTTATLTTGAEPRDSSFGDFDADGDQDLTVSNHDDRSISVYANDGSGSFTVAVTLLVNPSDRPEGLYAGDVDGDGKDDIVAATGDESSSQNRITVFIAASASSFAGPMLYNAGAGALDTDYVVLADLDCDGDLDAATANKTSNNISVLSNNGSGAFSSPQVFPAGTSPEHIIAASLGTAAYSGLVAVNRDSDNITVLVNNHTSCGKVVLGDANADGVVDVDDLVAVILGWGCSVPAGPCPADVDGSGLVDVDDLIMVILNWG